MRIKALVSIWPPGGTENEVARFSLADDGKLTWWYAPSSSPMLRALHEEMGIVGSWPGRRIKLDEGGAFFEALDFYYARSSVLFVVPIEAPAP